MMRGRGLRIFLFLIGFGAHALTLLADDGRIDLALGENWLRTIGLAGLLLAVTMVWRDFQSRDEVERRFALTASALSFAGTALIAYLGPYWPLLLVPAQFLWAVALSLWLVSFGLLQWRARW